MSTAQKSLKKPIAIALIFTILMVGMISLPAIFINFRVQYYEHLELKISLDRSASFVLQMPFILMNGKLTPSFVELDLDDEDLFSGEENILFDAAEINGSLFFKFLGYGQKLNLSSDFSSSPLSRQNYSRLMNLHEFSYSEEYNQTYLLIPIFFNSTLSDPTGIEVKLSLFFSFSYDGCANGGSKPLEMFLSHGWNQYLIPKSLLQSSCN